MAIVTGMMKTSLASSISNVNINQMSNNSLYIQCKGEREGGRMEGYSFVAFYYRLKLCDYCELPSVMESSSSFL